MTATQSVIVVVPPRLQERTISWLQFAALTARAQPMHRTNGVTSPSSSTGPAQLVSSSKYGPAMLVVGQVSARSTNDCCASVPLTVTAPVTATPGSHRIVSPLPLIANDM